MEEQKQINESIEGSINFEEMDKNISLFFDSEFIRIRKQNREKITKTSNKPKEVLYIVDCLNGNTQVSIPFIISKGKSTIKESTTIDTTVDSTLESIAKYTKDLYYILTNKKNKRDAIPYYNIIDAINFYYSKFLLIKQYIHEKNATSYEYMVKNIISHIIEIIDFNLKFKGIKVPNFIIRQLLKNIANYTIGIVFRSSK